MDHDFAYVPDRSLPSKMVGHMTGVGVLSTLRAMLSRSRAVRGPVSRRPPYLLVDISILWRRDAGTGIQRVVRALSEQLRKADMGEYELRFVAATRRLRYRFLELSVSDDRYYVGGRIEGRPGDIFLGLDLSSRILPRHARQIRSWRKRGMRIAIVVYDLLPAQHPDWFGDAQAEAFAQWLHVIGCQADHALCISRTVSEDLAVWLKREGLARSNLDICAFPLGGDLRKSRPSKGISDLDAETLAKLNGRKFIMTVGTIEPRKGHVFALDAFDCLMESRLTDAPALVVVGRPGWKTEGLQARMRLHPLKGDKFFWFEDASDELLEKLYQECAGVLFPTLAEGFGLPVAESLAHGRPVLARDLPVFREISSPLIHYFSDDAPAALAASILNWLEGLEQERAPCQGDALTWQKSCDILLKRLKITA